MPEPLPPDLVDALQRTQARRGCYGATVHYFGATGSTNDVAARLAEQGAPEGTLVVAGAQSSGRGRLGRDWFSPPGAGLYMSIVCRDGRSAPFATLAGGVSVADGIRAATGLPVEIKWPNDVVAPAPGAAFRKLAGVLAEASSTAAGIQHVVVGVGINLRPAAYPAALADRATSIEVELGRPVDGAMVFGEVLAIFAGHMAALSSGATAPLLSRWRALAPSSIGRSVAWERDGKSQSGVASGIADDGALLVRVGARVERIISGEVRWNP
jgi:BirA family biotin operon repressor/biotin-[acetyl-CoA-carboxylase] ligase